MTRAIKVWISGQVQGVGYRYHTAKQAQALGLTGWVRNLDDGRVEAVFEGEAIALEAMLTWCQEGPPAAQVTHLDSQAQVTQGYACFEIRR